MKYNGPIEAPIKKDQVVGKLRIIYDDEFISEHDLLALKDIKKSKYFLTINEISKLFDLGRCITNP